jgi:hypothetical protein
VHNRVRHSLLSTAPACVSDATAPSCRNGSGRSFSAPCPNRGLYSTPPHDIESRRIRWHWHTYGISRIHSQKKKVLLHLLQKRIYYRIHGYGHRDLSPRRATMALRLARPAAGSAAAAAGGRRAAPRSQSHARRRWAESRSPATERPDPIRRGHRPDPVSRSSRTALDWTTQCKCKCNARSTGRGHREIRLRQGVSGGRSPSWRAHARRVRAMGLWEKVRTRMQHCNPSHTHTHTHTQADRQEEEDQQERGRCACVIILIPSSSGLTHHQGANY